MGPMNIDYYYSTEFSYPSPSTTTESSANMVSQEYSGLDDADLPFPNESVWLDNFPDPEDYYLDVNSPPLEKNNIPEDTATCAGLTKPRSFLCEICQRDFTRIADLKRHQTTIQEPVFRDCPMDGCSRKGRNGFVRKDHLVEHVRQFHGADIKKRKCSKRSKHLECFYLIRRLIARCLCRLRPGLS